MDFLNTYRLRSTGPLASSLELNERIKAAIAQTIADHAEGLDVEWDYGVDEERS